MTVVAQQPGPVAPTFVCWDAVAAQVVARRISEGPEFDSHCKQDFFLFSFLSLSILKTGPSWRWNTTDFQLSNKKWRLCI